MEINKKYSSADITILISSIILIGLNLYAYFGLFKIAEWLNICFISVTVILLILTILLFILKRFTWFRLIFVCIVMSTLFTWLYQLVIFLGYGGIFDSVDAMQNFIASTGAWGIAVFMFIQFAQVVFIPIPSVVTTVAGAILFGPTVAMILSLISIIFASYVAFFIGRFLGEKVVSWLVGKEVCEKYSKLLYDKGKYLFFLMMVFPIFPDDILCMVAGMTSMKTSFFSWTVFIARPLAIIPTCYFGGGAIIPFTGWGLIVWVILIVVMAVLFVLSYKYQNQIEKVVIVLSDKMTKKHKQNAKLQKNSVKNDEKSEKTVQKSLKNKKSTEKIENLKKDQGKNKTKSIEKMNNKVEKNGDKKG